MLKKSVYLISQIVLHGVAVGAIVYSFLPVAKWYLNFRPVWGVDFFLTVTLTNLLKNNFAPPYSFWNYAWFGGWPQFKYPLLSMYIASLLANFTDLVSAVLLLIIGATLVFLLGCYFLFYQLSRNVVLSAALAIFAGLSSGLYQTLTWAGSIPSYISQAAFPWVLGFLVAYFRGGKFRYFLASCLVAGLSIWIHPLVYMTYTVPAVTILILLKFDHGLALFWKIKHLLLFLTISLLISLPQFYSQVNFTIKSAVKTDYGASALSTTSAPTQWEITEKMFNKAQVVRIVTDNHLAIFLITAVIILLAILSLLVNRRLAIILKSIPFLVLCGYFAFYIWLFGQGISIYHGGWYRLFWSVPVWIGTLASVLWYFSHTSLREKITSQAIYLIFSLSSSALILLMVVFFLVTFNSKIIISSIIYRSQVSSAYPDVINLKISDRERANLKDTLIPSWLNSDETNWRLYDGDQTVNLWWNSYFKMPLARGYLDPPFEDAKRGYIFWQDAALSEVDRQAQLVVAFGYPEATAISNALFLIDWNAIKYYEGGHEGAAFTPLPTYLKDYLVKRVEKLDFNEDRYTKRPVTLTYSELKDEATSPILAATNASTIAIFATEQGFETVVRAIAERENINSQKLIPIKLGPYVDKYSVEELKNFESLYLYDWDFKDKDKTFKLLNNYVLAGRKVFVETGVEVKLSDGVLPNFFPVKMVERKGQGRQWELEYQENDLTRDVNFENFSPPVFDDDEWKLSFAQESELRNGVTTILKNHGKIVMASQKLGSGEVIWSGLNLAYHLNRNHNDQEAKFFLNILSSLVDLSVKEKPLFNTTFIDANSRKVSTQAAKGILFKEQAYPGWNAENVGGGSLKIYKAGPAYPGYMYVPIFGKSSEVEFTFSGSSIDKILVIISALGAIFIFEEVVLSGMILGRLRRMSFRLVSKHVGHWWEKEDEQ